jgi:hypothetical protein
MDEMWTEIIVSLVALGFLFVMKLLHKNGKISDDTLDATMETLKDAQSGKLPGVNVMAAKELEGAIKAKVAERLVSTRLKFDDVSNDKDPDPKKKKRPVLRFLKDLAVQSTLGAVSRRFR